MINDPHLLYLLTHTHNTIICSKLSLQNNIKQTCFTNMLTKLIWYKPFTSNVAIKLQSKSIDKKIQSLHVSKPVLPTIAKF